MKQLHYRDLTGIGLTEEQVKAIAASVTGAAGLDDQGQPKDGPATPPSDPFPLARSRTTKAAAGGE